MIVIQHFANKSLIYHQVNTHDSHLSHHYVQHTIEPSPLDKLPPNFLRDVEAAEEIDQISMRTMDQGDDQSGEWVIQRRGRVTASMFGEIVRRRAAYAPLVERLLYSKTRRTKAMQYGHDNEPKARELYRDYLHKFHHLQASVERTGFHIDYEVC